MSTRQWRGSRGAPTANLATLVELFDDSFDFGFSISRGTGVFSLFAQSVR